jgi:16S rRNA (adenine1518-N6/adenine1519-N6)-dimethyltransferase
VLLQAFYNIEYLFTVSETVFVPPPKVKSGVIRLKRNDRISLDCDEKKFIQVVKTAFNQRRKTLRNSLRAMEIDFEAGGMAEYAGKRAEQLSVEDFVRLTELATRRDLSALNGING